MFKKGLTVIVSLLFLCSPVLSEQVSKFKCFNVISGDTVVLVSQDSYPIRPLRVKLANIEAPQQNTDGFINSKNYLQELILDSSINTITYQTDNSGIVYAEIYIMGIDINEYMVRSGFARAKDDKYKKQEEKAKKVESGLWRTDIWKNDKF